MDCSCGSLFLFHTLFACVVSIPLPHVYSVPAPPLSPSPPGRSIVSATASAAPRFRFTTAFFCRCPLRHHRPPSSSASSAPPRRPPCFAASHRLCLSPACHPPRHLPRLLPPPPLPVTAAAVHGDGVSSSGAIAKKHARYVPNLSTLTCRTPPLGGPLHTCCRCSLAHSEIRHQPPSSVDFPYRLL